VAGPRGLRRRSVAARLLRSWFRIPPGAWMFDCCECCVFSSRGLCDELITRPEESYRLWCLVVCDLENSRMRRPWPTLGRSATATNNYNGSGEICLIWGDEAFRETNFTHFFFFFLYDVYVATVCSLIKLSYSCFLESFITFS
jgi:hypothetical protein